MSLIDELLEEVHRTRVALQHNKPEDIKLAIYVNQSMWHKLCRGTHQFNSPCINICIGRMRGEGDRIFGYPLYEVHGDNHPDWSIVELITPIKLAKPVRQDPRIKRNWDRTSYGDIE
tara:strand:+ start:137 stop:487 length:351 start_codon:yes stop_codon:yes gene_type:complete